MNITRLSVAVLFAVITPFSQAAADDVVQIDYREPLQHYSLRQATLEAPNDGPTMAESLRFDAFGRTFDVQLAVHHALLRKLGRTNQRGRPGIYRGNVAGDRDSWVRLVIADGVPSGLIYAGQTLYAVDAERNARSGLLQPAIYRLEDLRIAPGAMRCSDVAEAKTGAALFAAVTKEVASNAALGPGATQEIDLAVIGDLEFTSDHGANSEAALLTRMNNVDGIFSAQLGVQINVNQIDTFTSDDPFSDETDAGTLLDELADYRFNTPQQNANGLTHLFTGRELDGNTVGVAFASALCLRRFGAALTQGTNNVTIDSLVAAHEIGHNFGAPHDGTPGSACESTSQDFLMAPRLNGSDTFSACSITEMLDDVNRASCITPLAATDVSIIEGSSPGPALLGDSASISFDVRNAGTDTLNDVSVDVSVPVNVTLNSVSAGGASCTSGAGTATCSIASLASGSGTTVSLSVTATASGNATFNATASVAGDESAVNNQASSTLSVSDAVDLRVTAAAGTQVTVGNSVSTTLNIDNLATIAATGVTITLTPTTGVRIDTASWSPGNCSISGGVASCDAANLGAQSVNAINLSVTGVTAGAESIAVAATSNEVDRDTSNNNVSGQIRVNAVAGDDGGGGGALDWITCLLLTLLPVARLLSQRRVFATSPRRKPISVNSSLANGESMRLPSRSFRVS